MLFIDADKKLHTTLKTVLPVELHIISAFSGKEGLHYVKTQAPEVILLSDNCSDLPCLQILQSIINNPFSPPVIIISENDDLSFVILAVKNGAHYFLRKPLNIEKLKKTVVKALQNYAGVRNTFHTEREVPELAKIVGRSEKMRKMKHSIQKYAQSPFPVLILGESGTGKELIARAIHALSPRKEGPFIARNCGAIPSTLIQSELFGSEKGAFTDATSKPGSFELANNGSLFLDEIGEMDTLAQVHLLRVLESEELVRLGGVRKIPLNVRFITATNKNLQEAIYNKEFRKDLYYRINTLVLPVPPLRERKTDIPVLAQYFARSDGQNHHVLSTGSIQKLAEYPWPGNVRELKSTVQRASLHTETEMIEPKHILFNQ